MSRIGGLIGGLCVCALGVSAEAQVTAAVAAERAGAASRGSEKLEEIQVTAQRRDESASRTPVAVAVLTADEMAKGNIVSEQDLRTGTPGLSIRTGLNSNALNYSLRGQSQDPYASTRPGVLPYLNEVQIGGAGGASAPSSAFYDLQSVQVLKGPQGTLFGRSATGGAVLFTSQKPTDQFNGYVSGSLGNYDARKAEGAAGGPVDAAGILKVRLAGFYQERDGFQKNLFDGSTVGSFDRKGGRFSATLEPASTIKNELVFDYLKSSGSNTTGVLTGLMPFTGSPPPYVPVTLLYGGAQSAQAIATGAAMIQAFTGVDAATATAQYQAFFAGREDQSLDNKLAAQQARGPYKVDYDGPNLFEGESNLLSNATTVDLAEDITVRNIFGLATIDTKNAIDADGTSFAMSQSRDPHYITNESRQLSDELQLQGKALGGRLDYIAGAYFSSERMTQTQDSHSFDILFGGVDQVYHFRMENKTWAGYSQSTYDLNGDGLALTLGARYTSEDVEKDVLSQDSSYGLPGLAMKQSTTFESVSWTAGLKNQFTPDLLGYVVSRRAYKSGGFNGTLPATPGVDQFDEERVTDVELGAKYNGYVGDMPARFDVALYHNWIADSQRAAFALLGTGPAGLTVNVPKGKTYGVELQGLIEPVHWLSIGATLNYTHASYDDELTDLLGTGAPYDQVTDTPEYSGSVFSEVTVPLDNGLSTSFRGEVYGQSEAYTSPLSRNNFGSIISGYGLVNLRAGLADANSGWSVYANVKNLFDKTYYVGGQATGEVYQLNLLVPGEKRTFTVEARYDF